MRKFLTVIALAFMAAPALFAKAAPDFYFEGYEKVELSFLRENYNLIENGRRIRFEGWYVDNQWQPLYTYQARLKEIGLNNREFNVIKFSLKEQPSDDIRYSFPILLFRAALGDQSELKGLRPGQHLALYGTYFKLPQSEWSLVVDVVESIDQGGFEHSLVSDYRMAATFTPTPSPTPTPGPSWIKRTWAKINPQETATPTGTITPDATPGSSPEVTVTPTATPGPSHPTAKKKKRTRKHHKAPQA